MYYEKKTTASGGTAYLVKKDCVSYIFYILSHAQMVNNWHKNITVKPYRGKKYSNATWVIEG